MKLTLPWMKIRPVIYAIHVFRDPDNRLCAQVTAPGGERRAPHVLTSDQQAVLRHLTVLVAGTDAAGWLDKQAKP